MKFTISSRAIGYLIILATALLPFLPMISGKPMTYTYLKLKPDYVQQHGSFFDDPVCDSYKPGSVLQHRQARAVFLKKEGIARFDILLSVFRVLSLIAFAVIGILIYITKLENLITIRKIYTFKITTPFIKPHYDNSTLSLEERIKEKATHHRS